MATVINLRQAPRELQLRCVKIDRTSRWGNPFVIGSDGTREQVIDKYRRRLWHDVRSGAVTLKDLAALDGQFLGCWCAPLVCHGHVLARAAIWAKAELAARGPGFESRIELGAGATT